jgi:hypothetical protein
MEELKAKIERELSELAESIKKEMQDTDPVCVLGRLAETYVLLDHIGQEIACLTLTQEEIDFFLGKDSLTEYLIDAWYDSSYFEDADIDYRLFLDWILEEADGEDDE